MKFFYLASVVFVCTIILTPGVSRGGEADDAFCGAVATHYEVTAEEVASVREVDLATDEIPVVFHVARATSSEPVRIAKLRARGDSWHGITSVKNVGADAFYIMIGASFSSKTYSPLLGKYKMVSPDLWNKIELSDEDIVNLVNLKFISSYFDYSIFEVMKMRDNGDSFVTILTQVDMAKEAMREEEKARRRAAGKKKQREKQKAATDQ